MSKGSFVIVKHKTYFEYAMISTVRLISQCCLLFLALTI